MIFEVCTDSVKGAIAAGKYGAKRIELCAALTVGGLTPNIGLIQKCVELSTVEVNVIIRHKEGGFVYNSTDVELMKIDIEAAKKAGAKGVVFGILTVDNSISELNRDLVQFSKALGLEVTFHRAFDFVSDYEAAIGLIIEMGFDRLLTSGLQPTAIEGITVISNLQKQHGHEIQIVAGSGVNAENALKLAKTGIQNLHFTARKPSQTSTELSMGKEMVVDEDKIINITDLFI
ncbi:MAG: copper homeostasis protein CutC [Flavobacteriaceae bacterium]|nr:copper homeostasis protein CutC [Flavobacteriaceae bacterium]